jgi:hypothetical protein
MIPSSAFGTFSRKQEKEKPSFGIDQARKW